MTPLFALVLYAQPALPPPVQFDRLALADARQLDGRVMRVEFRPGKPAYTWPGPLRTFTGPAELDDDQERTVVLKGDRVADLKDGKRYRMVGMLRVIEHPAAIVNGVLIPAWSEIRFEEQ